MLDNALEAGILAFAPLLFVSRFVPLSITGLRIVTRAVPRGVVPFWAGIVLDTLDQRPGPWRPRSTASSSAGSRRPPGCASASRRRRSWWGTA